MLVLEGVNSSEPSVTIYQLMQHRITEYVNLCHLLTKYCIFFIQDFFFTNLSSEKKCSYIIIPQK